MKMNRTRLFFTIPFSLVALSLIILQHGREVCRQVVDDVSDQLRLSSRSELDQEKENALRFAIVLSANGDIKNRRGLEYIIER